MFPNPQDALPLPVHPNLERYKKLAKDLAKAANDSEPTVLHAWITNWMERLVKLANLTLDGRLPVEIDRWINELDEFILREKSSSKHLSLTKAQFILARSHGFDSWPKFAEHLKAVAASNNLTSNFECAADAIVKGDAKNLAALLRENPDLIRARSSREHHATLLHYVSANGVEGYRQKTPQNIVDITRILLDAGAEVDATAEVYGGGATLALAATSIHPDRAGVQEALLELLLRYGAALNLRDCRGNGIVSSALANGRPAAARYLADRGAELDLEAAAGLGRIDDVNRMLEGDPGANEFTRTQKERALLLSCEYGRNEIVELLLSRGVSIQATEKTGQSALHCAVLGGDPDTVALLLKRGADPNVENVYGGTALGQALWCVANGNPEVDYVPVVEELVKKTGVPEPEGISRWLSQQKTISSATKRRLSDIFDRSSKRSGLQNGCD
jgi:ankyrin repeat protein